MAFNVRACPLSFIPHPNPHTIVLCLRWCHRSMPLCVIFILLCRVPYHREMSRWFLIVYRIVRCLSYHALCVVCCLSYNIIVHCHDGSVLIVYRTVSCFLNLNPVSFSCIIFYMSLPSPPLPSLSCCYPCCC